MASSSSSAIRSSASALGPEASPIKMARSFPSGVLNRLLAAGQLIFEGMNQFGEIQVQEGGIGPKKAGHVVLAFWGGEQVGDFN